MNRNSIWDSGFLMITEEKTNLMLHLKIKNPQLEKSWGFFTKSIDRFGCLCLNVGCIIVQDYALRYNYAQKVELDANRLQKEQR